MYQEMKIFGFALDPLSPKPIVLLKGEKGTTVPLWVTSKEAVAMAAELIGRENLPEGERNDLVFKILDSMAIRISAIMVDLVDGVVSATISLFRQGEEVKVSVRPAEAVLAALKFRLPLLVSEEVVAQAVVADAGKDDSSQEAASRRFAEFLENLDPADLGKYPM